MLYRLAAQGQCRTLLLEGFADSTPRKLHVGWFTDQLMSKGAVEAREVAVQMLSAGEISAAVFAALVCPQLSVIAAENPEEYAAGLEFTGGNDDSPDEHGWGALVGQIRHDQ